MNNVKGFRFHPTEEELIEFLHLKTFDHDSSVQVIDEVPDICLWEPCQLAERSTLQTGDRLWYFIYSPKYKYRNSKRINRTTREGYWKPTGNARKIINPETGMVIGTKKTLVFYKGQCNDKNKIKTCWVMHEYELMASPNTGDIDQKTFNLCKLKKRRVDISSTGTSQSTQHNDYDSVGNQANSIESYVGKRSNQHNAVNDDVVSNLSSSFVNPVIDDAISKETLYLKYMSKECNASEGNSWIQKLYTMEKDDESYGSVLTNGDETIPIEKSNQHNAIVAAEGFRIPSSFKVLTNGDETIPIERSNQHNAIVAAEGFEIPSSFEVVTNGDETIPIERSNQHNDFQYDEGSSTNDLLEDSEAINNSNWIQNLDMTDLDDEFWNSTFSACLQEENRQQCLAAENKVSSLQCICVMESSDSVEKPKKRRLSHDVHVKTT